MQASCYSSQRVPSTFEDYRTFKIKSILGSPDVVLDRSALIHCNMLCFRGILRQIPWKTLQFLKKNASIYIRHTSKRSTQTCRGKHARLQLGYLRKLTKKPTPSAEFHHNKLWPDCIVWMSAPMLRWVWCPSSITVSCKSPACCLPAGMLQFSASLLFPPFC